MSQEQDVIAFWDSTFSSQEPFEVKKSEIMVDDDLTKDLLFVGQNAHRIIDVGCGLGDLLITLSLLNDGKNDLLGLDASSSAIKIAEASALKSKAGRLRFSLGGLDALQKIDSGSVDGIISSNFLDVIPLTLAHRFLKEMSRLIEKGGLFLLKINFFIDPSTLGNPRYRLAEEGVFLDGVLRSNNQTTEAWLGFLGNDFTLLKQGEFARLGPTAPRDRLFLLKKK